MRLRLRGFPYLFVASSSGRTPRLFRFGGNPGRAISQCHWRWQSRNFLFGNGRSEPVGLPSLTAGSVSRRRHPSRLWPRPIVPPRSWRLPTAKRRPRFLRGGDGIPRDTKRRNRKFLLCSIGSLYFALTEQCSQVNQVERRCYTEGLCFT